MPAVLLVTVSVRPLLRCSDRALPSYQLWRSRSMAACGSPGSSIACARPTAFATAVAAPRSLTCDGSADSSAPEVARFLSSLAIEGQVAASTQNQALSALLFL